MIWFYVSLNLFRWKITKLRYFGTLFFTVPTKTGLDLPLFERCSAYGRGQNDNCARLIWIHTQLFQPFSNESAATVAIEYYVRLWSFSFIGHVKDKEVYSFCCDQKTRGPSAQSFTLWQQATIEITRRDHSYLLFAPHVRIWVLFFAHIPFVVKRTFNATLTERLQHYQSNSMIYFSWWWFYAQCGCAL